MVDDGPIIYEKFEDFYREKGSVIRDKLKSPHDDLGFVLKSHLIAEQYLTKYLIAVKPVLNINKNYPNCSQKIKLLDESDGNVFENKNALEQLNRIRNRFAHNFSADLEIQDDSALAIFGKNQSGEFEETFAVLVARLKQSNADKENVLCLEDIIQSMKSTSEKDDIYLGCNLALLAGKHPKVLIANFVIGFCETVEIEIYRHENVL